MRCPRDPLQQLVKLLGDAEAYTCDRCGGLFFTRGELDRLAEPHQGSLEFSSVDLDSFSQLKRLIELNLGDPALLNRELSALGT